MATVYADNRQLVARTNNELLAIKLILEMGVTKVKHLNKGHTPNKGQKPMYQDVRYSESPLYNIAPLQLSLVYLDLFVEVVTRY